MSSFFVRHCWEASAKRWGKGRPSGYVVSLSPPWPTGSASTSCWFGLQTCHGCGVDIFTLLAVKCWSTYDTWSGRTGFPFPHAGHHKLPPLSQGIGQTLFAASHIFAKGPVLHSVMAFPLNL